MLLKGKRYAIFQPYCENAGSREMVEHAGLTWTQGHQDSWDRHQKVYETHLLAATMSHPTVDIDSMEQFINKHRGHLFVGGPLEDCEPLDLEATRDRYGGKLRAGEKDGQWKRQRCLVCGAFTRQWLIPDEEPKSP